MAPTTSVRSIRLPNTAWEWLAKEAARRKLTVNGLVAEWVAGEMAEDELGDAGPAFLMSPPSKGLYPPVPVKPAKKKRVEPWKGTGRPYEPETFRVALPAAEAPHVSVPLHKPKPFNPPAEARQEVSEWRPIESAPQDGTVILAWDGQGMTTVEWCKSKHLPGWWRLSECGFRAEDSEFYDPTHWMPLPEPPR